MCGKVLHRLVIPEGVQSFSLSPCGEPYKIVALKPEFKGAPAQVRVWAVPDLAREQMLASKSFFNCEEVAFKWDSRGRAVLVRSSTAVDKGSKGKFSGSSFYYGASSLHLLFADGSFEGTVPLDKEGPVQDFAWVPGCLQFCVIYGYMPALTTMFDAQCKPLYTFGTGYRNEIHMSDSGRFMALCGFGNLPGDMEFWDRRKQANGLMGIAKGEAVTMAAYAPDSRAFLTATTDRMKVDNRYTVWGMDGKKVYEKLLGAGDELHEAAWRPARPGVYPPPPNPPKYIKLDQKAREAGGGAATAKPAAYVAGRGGLGGSARPSRGGNGKGGAAPTRGSVSPIQRVLEYLFRYGIR